MNMRKYLTFAISLLMTALLAIAPLHAVEPGELLPDAAQEARARAISTELRCLVCQNQSIDDSNAPLARDLRLLVRERISAGDDNAAVLRFIVARYGDFVLLKPPFNINTVLLWLTPLLTLILAIFAFRRSFSATRNGQDSDAVPLNDAENRRLSEVLKSRTE